MRRHRRAAALAPRRGPARPCRPGSTWSTSTPGTAWRPAALPVAAVQPARRRVRRQLSRTACACCARCSRTPCTRPTGAPRSPPARASTSSAAPGGLTRDEVDGGRRHPRRAARPVGLRRGDWDDDSSTSRFAGPGPHRSTYVRAQAADEQAGRRGRPLHLPRPDGRAGAQRRARPHRRGPAVDRRPVPARQDPTGRLDDIRECIGCNVCVSGDFTCSPIRCTQNPTMGEEWRRGWHPERISPARSAEPVLVVGAGPAGLEAARWLGRRGLPRHPAEATRELGGRVATGVGAARAGGLAAGRRLPGAAAAPARQRRGPPREPDDGRRRARASASRTSCVATGAGWRADGVGRWHTGPVPVAGGQRGAQPRRPHGGGPAAGPRGRRLRRRPLLPGRRARRAARP